MTKASGQGELVERLFTYVERELQHEPDIQTDINEMVCELASRIRTLEEALQELVKYADGIGPHFAMAYGKARAALETKPDQPPFLPWL